MPDDLITLVLRPLADPDSVDRRLRWLLKRSLRWHGFHCVSIASGPEAWVGWVWNKERGWIRVCTHATPNGALALLLEAAPEEPMAVLPQGVRP